MVKISDYGDFHLWWRVFSVLLKITFAHSTSLLPITDPPVKQKRKYSVHKIYRYVGWCLYLRRILGFHDSCLIRSVLLCRLLRESGWEARINFGTRKTDVPVTDGWPIIGHCWVTLGGENVTAEYPFVFSYPGRGEAG